VAIKETARIYNIFPRIAGNITNWISHFPRITNMKFNWIFLNPFHYSGFSGSLYSIKDYYKLNPMFYDQSNKKTEIEQLKWMIDEAHKLGIKVMMDLVVNHTAVDHPFTKTHKEWYKWEGEKIVNPGAWDGNNWVSWGDLAEIDNEYSSDKKNLWKYWLDIVIYYLKLGFDGFRCDAAYKLPIEFWEYIISKSKKQNSKVVWFAESLGCQIEDTIKLGESGFEYTFNSSKWWDYEEEWCLEQYNKNLPYSKSISFPESHDTNRIYDELHEDPRAVKHKYLFSALFSAGIMIPIGFEYGFKRRLSVVSTTPEDFEEIHHDFSQFISEVNTLKSTYQIFNEESYLEKIPVEENVNIKVLLKTSLNKKEKCLLIINKDFSKTQTISIEKYLSIFPDRDKIKDISISYPVQKIYKENNLSFKPAEIKIIYCKAK